MAFEEFSKHIMIADRAQKKIPITDKEWINDFSDHRTKLHALKRTIEAMKPPTDLEDKQSRELN